MYSKIFLKWVTIHVKGCLQFEFVYILNDNVRVHILL